MSERKFDTGSTDACDDRIAIEREKRHSSRKTSRSAFVMTVNPIEIEGVGSNISQTGAYFVTCDEIPVELVIKDGQGERKIPGKIVRIDTVIEGSHGVAVHFDTRQL